MFRSIFFLLTVLSSTCYCSWCPFRVPGLLSTLCTAFYALVGMLLRGGKTVEGRKFFFFFFFAKFLSLKLYLLLFLYT